MAMSAIDRAWAGIRLADYALGDGDIRRAQTILGEALDEIEAVEPPLLRAFYIDMWLERVVRLAELQNARREKGGA